MHYFQEAWPASCERLRNRWYLAVALATWFLYNVGPWRVPRPADVVCPEVMTTQHTQQRLDMLAWLEDWTTRKKSNTKRKGSGFTERQKIVKHKLHHLTADGRESGKSTQLWGRRRCSPSWLGKAIKA